MKVGTYVVYSKARAFECLGRTKKDIWKIRKVYSGWNDGIDQYDLESLSKDGKGFSTSSKNAISVQELIDSDNFKQSYFIHEAYTAVMNSLIKLTESKTMRSQNSKTVVKRTTDANVDAAKLGARIATGRTVNAVALEKVKGKLPIYARGYADSAFGAVVLANIVDFGIKQYFADNAKFNYVSDAMMQAAMVDLMAEFDFEGMINDILSNVTLGDIADEPEA